LIVNHQALLNTLARSSSNAEISGSVAKRQEAAEALVMFSMQSESSSPSKPMEHIETERERDRNDDLTLSRFAEMDLEHYAAVNTSEAVSPENEDEVDVDADMNQEDDRDGERDSLSISVSDNNSEVSGTCVEVEVSPCNFVSSDEEGEIEREREGDREVDVKGASGESESEYESESSEYESAGEYDKKVHVYHANKRAACPAMTITQAMTTFLTQRQEYLFMQALAQRYEDCSMSSSTGLSSEVKSIPPSMMSMINTNKSHSNRKRMRVVSTTEEEESGSDVEDVTRAAKVMALAPTTAHSNVFI
jgi:hypothetical protein